MKRIAKLIFKAFLMLIFTAGQFTVLACDLIGGFIVGVLGSIVLFFLLMHYFYKNPNGTIKEYMETHKTWKY